MGAKLMPIPEEPWVRFAGMLSEQERLHALEAATVVVVPSPFESLSLLALEALAVGTPILASARSEVRRASLPRKQRRPLLSRIGYEFVEALRLLMVRPSSSARHGRQWAALRQEALPVGRDSQ